MFFRLTRNISEHTSSKTILIDIPTTQNYPEESNSTVLSEMLDTDQGQNSNSSETTQSIIDTTAIDNSATESSNFYYSKNLIFFIGG